jgi:hypothetical protein
MDTSNDKAVPWEHPARFSGLVGSRGAEYDAELRRQRRGPTWPVPRQEAEDVLAGLGSGSVAVQRLIREAMEASGGQEQEGFLEVKVHIPYFGKPEHGWRTALRLIRVLRENWPNAKVIGAGDVELISDDSDDISETWHTINYKEERARPVAERADAGDIAISTVEFS